MQQLIALARTRYDYVVIDAPPLLPVTDAAVLTTLADGAILVARHGHTKREELSRATENLRAVDARILGTVLNMVPAKSGAYEYAYYYETETTPAAAGGGSVAAAKPVAGGRGGRRRRDLAENDAPGQEGLSFFGPDDDTDTYGAVDASGSADERYRPRR
jgi:Mrp family chromosome partitioning ATPase